IELLYETTKNEKSQLQTELEQLQIGLTIEGLEQMTFPFYLERTWNELKQTNDQIYLEREQLEDEHFLLNGKLERAGTEQRELESSLPDEEEIIRLTDKIDSYHRQAHEQYHMEKKTKK